MKINDKAYFYVDIIFLSNTAFSFYSQDRLD